MKKEELEKLESVGYEEKIPLLDTLYVVSSAKKHESGYKFIEVYGITYGKNNEIVFAKKLTDCADVIHVSVDLTTFDPEYLEKTKFFDGTFLYIVDFMEKGVAHYFFLGFTKTKFRVDGCGFSNFRVNIVYAKD